jgi:hypothetical protein
MQSHDFGVQDARNKRPLTESKFVDQLVREIHKGYSLVPFVGSGLSQPSGILMGKEFSNYLQWVVYTCIAGEKHRPFWDLHRQGWPHMPDDDEVNLANCWRKETSEKLKASQQHIKTWSETSPPYLHHRALESLKDWRATLHFLAKLHQPNGPTSLPYLNKNADQSIIDKFNLHITRGRRPNFGHSMLCHLAGPARIRTILTTNFDTLIEDAFTELDQRFEVISVGIKGELPHPDTVHSINCVIKLHGSISETRADLSLDEKPSQTHKDRFFHYVRCYFPNEERSHQVFQFRPGHLLVVGYSGGDRRCLHMIKYVLDKDPRALVFWICFNVDAHNELMGSAFPKIEYDNAYRGRVIAAVSSNPDLLLYGLYQQLTLCVPSGGFTYQLSPNMPFGGNYGEDPEPQDHNVDDNAKSIYKKLQDLQDEEKFVIVDSESGLSAPLRRAFFDAMSGLVRTAMWLELEDYFNITHLAHEILQIIAVRTGHFQLDHAVFLPADLDVCGSEWRKHCKLLFKAWRFEPSSYLIVLYARNGCGGCVGWNQQYWTAEEGNITQFVKSLAALGFKIVFAPYSQARCIRDLKKEEAVHRYANNLRGNLDPKALFFVEEQSARGRMENDAEKRYPDVDAEYRISEGGLPGRHRKVKLQYEKPCDWPEEHVVIFSRRHGKGFEMALDLLAREWLEDTAVPESPVRLELQDRVDRQLFLYGCTLFRQSRHYAAFFIDAVMQCPYRFNIEGLDNDRQRFAQLNSCLEYFDSIDSLKIFHRKPGGSAWMHRDVRLGTRHLLESAVPFNLSPNSEAKIITRMRQLRAACHYTIADWYTKAFHTTGHH